MFCAVVKAWSSQQKGFALYSKSLLCVTQQSCRVGYSAITCGKFKWSFDAIQQYVMSSSLSKWPAEGQAFFFSSSNHFLLISVTFIAHEYRGCFSSQTCMVPIPRDLSLWWDPLAVLPCKTGALIMHKLLWQLQQPVLGSPLSWALLWWR